MKNSVINSLGFIVYLVLAIIHTISYWETITPLWRLVCIILWAGSLMFMAITAYSWKKFETEIKL
jgi:hypothetical protein